MSDRANPIMVLHLRAWARAQLYDYGELELDDAVDALWQAAETTGVLDQIGEEATIAIIRKAFEGIADL